MRKEVVDKYGTITVGEIRASINIQYQYKAVLILILNIEYSTILAWCFN